MKYFKLILIILLFFSCKEKRRIDFDNNLLTGNWFDVKKDFYQEYYFDHKNMYTYDPYSGNTSQYHYEIRNDSIFRYFIHPEIKQEYEFYDKIIKFDSIRIKLGKTTLDRIEEVNTLKMFIDNEIDEKTYYKSCINREKTYVSPILKKGNKINLDNI